MEEQIDRFKAASDDGTVFTVVIYQDMVESRQLGGDVQYIKGLKRCALTDGRHVNMIDATTFKIVSTDQIIRKI